jgi:RNase adapter protein RapZ
LREGKRFVTIAVGCTGGKHRSVSVAREIARQLNEHSSTVEISAHATHRDVGRE